MAGPWPGSPVPRIAIELGKGLYIPLAEEGGAAPFSLPTMTVTGAVWFPLGPRFALTAELPISRVSQRFGPTTLDATVIGDPWIGFETRFGDFTWEGGVRPGLSRTALTPADVLARANGIVADYDHYEAWVPGYQSLRTTLHYDHQFSSGLFVGSMAGGSVARPTRHNEEDEATDLYLLYGVRLGIRRGGAGPSVAFLGRAYPTAHGEEKEPTVNQVAIDVTGLRNRVRPVASFRVYRDRLLRPQTVGVLSVGLKVWR